MAGRATQDQISDLYGLIEQIETAMLTTRRADGRLVSRPMATQKREPIADLWFVTGERAELGDTTKLDLRAMEGGHG
jgi:general stress protein 26